MKRERERKKQRKREKASRLNVNARDIYKRTPLHWASANGHYKACELLIKAGADVNAKDKEGRIHFLVAGNVSNPRPSLSKNGGKDPPKKRRGRRSRRSPKKK